MMQLMGTPTRNKTADKPCRAGYHHRGKKYEKTLQRVLFDVMLDSHKVSFRVILKVHTSFECYITDIIFVLMIGFDISHIELRHFKHPAIDLLTFLF